MKKRISKLIILLPILALIFTLGACGKKNDEGKTSESQAISSSVDKYQAAIDQGSGAIESESYDEAKAAFEDALKEKPKDELATTLIAQVEAYQAATAAIDQGDLTSAITEAQTAKDEKNGSDVLAKRASDLLDQITTFQSDLANYQAIYDKAQAEYDAGKYDAAAGSIQTLLDNDLSNAVFSGLKGQATTLQATISEAQKTAQQAATTVPDTQYAAERNSEIIAEKFLAATGTNIKDATDDQIAAFLANDQTATSSTPAATATNNQQSSNDQIQAIVGQKTGYTGNDYFYFITKENDDLYRIEIRQNNKVDTDLTNLLGMFEYIPSTDSLTVMDYLTGDYVPFTK